MSWEEHDYQWFWEQSRWSHVRLPVVGGEGRVCFPPRIGIYTIGILWYGDCSLYWNVWNKPITFFAANKIFPLFVLIEDLMGIPSFLQLQKGLTFLLNDVFQRKNLTVVQSNLEAVTKTHIVQKATKDAVMFTQQLLQRNNPVPPTGRFRSFLETIQFQSIDSYGTVCDDPTVCRSEGRSVTVCPDNEYLCDENGTHFITSSAETWRSSPSMVVREDL